MGGATTQVRMASEIDPFSVERGEAVALSTGQTLELPVEMEVDLWAVVVPADRERVAELLPEGLSPIRAGRGTAAVWLLTERFHDVEGDLGSFDEFAIALAATPGGPSGIPYVSPVTESDIYIWQLPVSTEEAVAFGEVWNYPGTLADIEISEEGGYKQTRVSLDGDHLITTRVKPPRAIPMETMIPSYVDVDGMPARIPATMRGDLGIWPYTTRFTYTLGTHPLADEIRSLGLGNRAFARTYGDVDITIQPAEPV
jgi:hypothetical protein